jgi:general stress protein YciG
MQGDSKKGERLKAAAAVGGQGVVAARGVTHMAEIGRKGGSTTAKNRAHMAEIGRRGGLKSRRGPVGGVG